MVTRTQTQQTRSSPAGDGASTADYRLFWRRRASTPWRREEFQSREEAFDRFFYLLGKGLEIRWRSLDKPR
ncbi:MAG: hypothetical protein KY475_01645 [Planctomycetes bacterium]|nr:hypothetical protein [Planctomycetota bacterium]